VPDKYLPAEEIIDRGYAVFTFYRNDITTDKGTKSDGLSKIFKRCKRKLASPGKLALWAWCAMRVMDYIETLDTIDKDNVAVVGHSRLGKTALLAGAFDERFKYVISNDSGCCGAAIERGKVGERYDRITKVFPYWFCPQFNREVSAGEQFTFDQNFLLSLSVPRCLIIGSAKEDIWADPMSEFLGVASLNDAYSLYGMKGLVHNGEMPKARAVLDEGDAVYYVREGTHFMSRHDWNTYMDIIDKRRK
jgi:hypothetical protein